MKAVRAAFLFQLGLMLPAWVAFVTRPAGLGTVYLVFYVMALGFAVALYTGWKSVHRAPVRPLFGMSVVATCLTVATPFVMDRFALPPLSIQALVVSALVLGLLAAVILLANRQRWQPGTMLGGRVFNRRMLFVLAVVIVFIWVPIIGWLAADHGVSTVGSGKGGTLRTLFLVYYTGLGVFATMLVSFSLLTAIAGLVRHSGYRLLHAGQLAASLLLLVSLGLVGGGIGLALVNPG